MIEFDHSYWPPRTTGQLESRFAPIWNPSRSNRERICSTHTAQSASFTIFSEDASNCTARAGSLRPCAAILRSRLRFSFKRPTEVGRALTQGQLLISANSRARLSRDMQKTPVSIPAMREIFSAHRDPGHAERVDEVVDRARRHALDVGFLDHRGDRLLGQPARLEEGGEVAALAQLRDPQLDRPGAGLPDPVAVAVAPPGRPSASPPVPRRSAPPTPVCSPSSCGPTCAGTRRHAFIPTGQTINKSE